MHRTHHPPRRRAALPAVLATVALVLLLAASPAQASASAAPADRPVTTQLPDTPAGRQLAWFIEASTRLPIADAELRAHFTPEFLATPGGSPQETNASLGALIDESGVKLLDLTVAERDRIVAIVSGRSSS